MRFQPVKCSMMQLTRKHLTLNKIQASYTLEGTVLENVDITWEIPLNFPLMQIHFPC